MARNLDPKEEKVFLTLLKSSNISDRELASRTGLSQPTVTRIRNRLERQGVIQQYQVIPSLTTIGLSLMTFTMFRIGNFDSRKKIFEWMKGNPKIVFASEGEGLKENILMISLHPSFRFYQEFLNDFRSKFGNDTTDMLSFVTNTDNICKNFSLQPSVDEFLNFTVKKLREERRSEERNPTRARKPKTV